MSTYVNPGTPNHTLTSVTVTVALDLTGGTVQRLAAFGHSDTTKGVLWTAKPSDPIALDDEPYAFSIVASDVADLLERAAHFLPNTQGRFDFCETGGLHAMDPMF